MSLSTVSKGDIIQFITKVDKSQKGQDIQQVILKVTSVSSTHVVGINAFRALDTKDGKKPFRSFKVSNIVNDSVWKLIA